MLCPNCGPYPRPTLRKSGWVDPEYICPVCRRYFNSDGVEQGPPEPREDKPSGLIFNEDSEDYLYGGSW